MDAFGKSLLLKADCAQYRIGGCTRRGIGQSDSSLALGLIKLTLLHQTRSLLERASLVGGSRQSSEQHSNEDAQPEYYSFVFKEGITVAQRHPGTRRLRRLRAEPD